MALTTVARLSLEGKGFQTLFTNQRVHWTEMVERARELMVTHVPGGNPTIDDVKRVLLPLVELDGHYLAHVNNHHPRDRKSTRLNSSHLVISYAVFCLKKKK